MSQSSQEFEVAQSNTTTNYGVYDSPDGDETQAIVGMYISEGITEDLGEYVTVVLDVDDDGVPATLDRTTSGYGVFSTQADAIESVYVAHEVLAEFVDNYDSDDAIEAVGVTLMASDEEAFEEALDAATTSEEETEAEADALLASDESDDSDEEEVEISDEELDLVDQ